MTRKDLSIGNFRKIFCNVVFMLHSFEYYISRERDQDLSVSTETTQQMHQSIDRQTSTMSPTRNLLIFAEVYLEEVKVRWQLYYIFS